MRITFKFESSQFIAGLRCENVNSRFVLYRYASSSHFHLAGAPPFPSYKRYKVFKSGVVKSFRRLLSGVSNAMFRQSTGPHYRIQKQEAHEYATLTRQCRVRLSSGNRHSFRFPPAFLPCHPPSSHQYPDACEPSSCHRLVFGLTTSVVCFV